MGTKEHHTKGLIFDFDGTLVDSFHKIIEQFNRLADEFSLTKVPFNRAAQLRDLSSKKVVQFLQVPIFKIPTVVYRMRKSMKEEITTVPPFFHLYEVLQKLYSAHYFMGIVTSNSIQNVDAWLSQHKMKPFFNFVHAEHHYFGKHRALKKILKKYGLDEKSTFYVGDETRDIEAAKKNHMGSIAVTWGFNSEKTLSFYQPDHLVRCPHDLLALFNLK